jgi:hypothetical protein
MSALGHRAKRKRATRRTRRHAWLGAYATRLPAGDGARPSRVVQGERVAGRDKQLGPFAPAVELLCTIPGVGRRAAEVIIAETGVAAPAASPAAPSATIWTAQSVVSDPGTDEPAAAQDRRQPAATTGTQAAPGWLPPERATSAVRPEFIAARAAPPRPQRRVGAFVGVGVLCAALAATGMWFAVGDDGSGSRDRASTVAPSRRPHRTRARHLRRPRAPRRPTSEPHVRERRHLSLYELVRRLRRAGDVDHFVAVKPRRGYQAEYVVDGEATVDQKVVRSGPDRAGHRPLPARRAAGDAGGGLDGWLWDKLSYYP